MASVNKVVIVGNLGKDPEIRTFPNGDQVANVTVATTDKWKDKTTGESKESTEWHRITFHARLAEIAGKYLRKGSQVYIEGSLRTRKWTDQQTGQERYATEIRADNMQMLGGKAASASSAPTVTPKQPADSSAWGYQGQHSPAQQTAPAVTAGFGGVGDEDIPF